MDPLKKLLSKTRKAMFDYNMISSGDKIAIGLSGGKDSMILALLLKRLSTYVLKDVEIVAICLDLGFDGFNEEKIRSFCSNHDIPLVIEKTRIAEIVFDIQKPKSPCALCANLRRGALNNLAKTLGCNKTALGHHMDDVIETSYLSMLYEGRLSVFSPVTYLSRSELTVLRPMIYIEEHEIIDAMKNLSLTPFKNPCKIDGHSRRETMKGILKDIYIVNPAFKNNMFNVILGSKLDGWDIPADRSKK